jgi:hypothetical protein
MNIMSSSYSSFGPQIANYEREQQLPLQFIVKSVLDVLLGIVNFAVKAHFAPGAAVARALAPTAVANETILSIYLRQARVFDRFQKNFGTVCKISIAILPIPMALTILGTTIGMTQLLMGTTSLLIILFATTVSSNCAGSLAIRAYRNYASRRQR